MFFRELPEPLIPFDLYEPLVNAYREEKYEEVVQISKSMSPTNYAVLSHLLRFLGIITHYRDVNKMTTANIAIVFAPNLMRPKVETFLNIARDTPITIGIIKDLINEEWKNVDVVALEKLMEVFFFFFHFFFFLSWYFFLKKNQHGKGGGGEGELFFFFFCA